MKCKDQPSRRTFLKGTLAAGLSAAIPAPLIATACGPFGGHVITPNGNSLLPGGIPLDGLSPTEAPATVAAVKGRSLADMTGRALADLGGIDIIIAPGDTVFIKPNFLTAGLPRDNHTSTGEITKPEVVIATAEACLRAGAAEVIIGDGAQVFEFDFEELRTLDGSTHLAAEVARLNNDYDDRVRAVCLNRDSPAWDALPAKRINLGQILVSSLVARADKLISIATLKTHRFATLSLSMKNLMGVPPIERYGGGSEDVGRYLLHNSLGGPEGAFLDLVAGLQPDLAIIDASISCEGQGPWVRPDSGRTVDVRARLGDWLILASRDCVAVDTTAARIVGQDYRDIPYLVSAYEQGLGQANAAAITLLGPPLDELRMEWEPARLLI